MRSAFLYETFLSDNRMYKVKKEGDDANGRK